MTTQQPKDTADDSPTTASNQGDTQSFETATIAQTMVELNQYMGHMSEILNAMWQQSAQHDDEACSSSGAGKRKRGEACSSEDASSGGESHEHRPPKSRKSQKTGRNNDEEWRHNEFSCPRPRRRR